MLAAQSEEGVLESEGSFSIDLERARAKSHRFGAENQDKALLKLMMAVLATQPSGVDIKMGKDLLTFEVRGAQRLIGDARTLGGELGEALWSCHFSGFSRIACMLRGQCLEISNNGIQENKERAFDSHHTVVVELVYEKSEAGLWETMKTLLRGRSRSAFAFQQELRFAPLPVTLDARAVNTASAPADRKLALELFLTGSEQTGAAEISSLAQNLHQPRYSLIKNRKFTEEGSWSTYCKFQRPASKKPFGLRCESWLTVKEHSLLGHLWVPLETLPTVFGGGRNWKSGRLTLVKHGVVVGEMAFPVCGVVSAHGLDTDITGLQVVSNKKLEALDAYLKDALQRCYRKTRDLKPPGSVLRALERHPVS